MYTSHIKCRGKQESKLCIKCRYNFEKKYHIGTQQKRWDVSSNDSDYFKMGYGYVLFSIFMFFSLF